MVSQRAEEGGREGRDGKLKGSEREGREQRSERLSPGENFASLFPPLFAAHIWEGQGFQLSPFPCGSTKCGFMWPLQPPQPCHFGGQ